MHPLSTRTHSPAELAACARSLDVHEVARRWGLLPRAGHHDLLHEVRSFSYNALTQQDAEARRASGGRPPLVAIP